MTCWAANNADEDLLFATGCHLVDGLVIWGGPYNDAVVLDRVAWTWCSAVAQDMIHQLQRLRAMGVMADDEAVAA